MRLNKKTVVTAIMVLICMLSAVAACAAEGGSSAAAAAAALTGQSGAAQSGSSQTGSSTGDAIAGGADADGADTGITAPPSAFPEITDPSLSEPETTVIREQLTEDTIKNPATHAAPDGTTENNSRLEPKEAKGSSMFDNLRGKLPRFGADFFRQRRGNTLVYAPVGPNYTVAPGDEVKITLWGYNDIRANLVVDRDGIITLPQAGPVEAAGLTFADLQKAVKNAYSRILNDFEINVSMGKLHTINVYVTGHAARPGAYAVSSMATVIDLLSEAGGPAGSGSMRGIELKRGNKKVAGIDVYELLLKGNRNGDLRLRDGDVIFIPTVGPLVSVAGNVKRPAVYELTAKEKTLADLLHLSGGLASGAYKGRVQIVRVQDKTVRTAFEAELGNAAEKAQKLQDGDLVKIFAVPGGAISVRVAGAVIQPGVYVIDPGKTTLGEILKRAGGLMYNAANMGELTRIQPSEKGPVTSRMMLNMKEAQEGKLAFTLLRDDYIFVRTVPDWNLYRSASVTGRVLYPGSYAIKQGERLSSLLERAGGFAEAAFPRGAVFVRESVKADQQQQITDMIARLEREIAAAGNEAISTAVNTQDVTFAKSEMAQKDRLMTALKNLKATGRVIIQLPENYKLLKGSPYDIPLMEGDKLYVPSTPGTIQVLGAVILQSTFVYRPGQPVSQYIREAGNYSLSANARRTYILRADGSTVRAFSGGKAQPVLDGDFIVVPEKTYFTPKMRNATDLIDIVYKMVLGVAAINYIF